MEQLRLLKKWRGTATFAGGGALSSDTYPIKFCYASSAVRFIEFLAHEAKAIELPSMQSAQQQANS
jgi:hypothetical protein